MKRNYKGVMFVPSTISGVKQCYGRWKFVITIAKDGNHITKGGFISEERARVARNNYIRDNNLSNEIQSQKEELRGYK